MLNKICHKIPGLRSLLRQLETARYQRVWLRQNTHNIARGVRFLLSCNHQTGTLTAFPLRSHLEGGHHPAGAVVTHDVPPYTIVAGNPARVIRTRLPQPVVEKLADFRLADVPEEQLRTNLDKIYRPLHTAADAENLLKHLT